MWFQELSSALAVPSNYAVGRLGGGTRLLGVSAASGRCIWRRADCQSATHVATDGEVQFSLPSACNDLNRGLHLSLPETACQKYMGCSKTHNLFFQTQCDEGNRVMASYVNIFH